jgi:hypothetical protein
MMFDILDASYKKKMGKPITFA